MFASLQGNTEIVELVLEAGASLDVQNDSGSTALIKASSQGYIEVVELLLKHGANPNLKDVDELTALTYSRRNSNAEVSEILKKAGAKFDSSIILYKMDVLILSDKFMKYCEIVESFDPEDALNLILQEARLSFAEFKSLILQNDISCITPLNFEDVLNTLYSHEFRNLDVVITKLNEQRDLSFPPITSNPRLKEIIDHTCICKLDKCTVYKVLERDHPKCFEYLYKEKQDDMQFEVEKFPHGAMQYSAGMIKYLIEKRYIRSIPDNVFFDKIIGFHNLEVVKFCIENRYINLGRKYNVYDKSPALARLFLEHKILDIATTITCAILNNDPEMLDLIYKKGFHRSHCSRQAFIGAAIKGHEAILNYLFDKGVQCHDDPLKFDEFDDFPEKIRNLLYKRVDKKYFDDGREVDPSLSPVKIAFVGFDKSSKTKLMVAPFFINQIQSTEPIWVNYKQYESWKEVVGKRPLDSLAYAVRFGIKCSTPDEINLYLEILVDGASPKWFHPSLVHIKNDDGEWYHLRQEKAIKLVKEMKQDVTIAPMAGTYTWQDALKFLYSQFQFDPVTITAGMFGSSGSRKLNTKTVYSAKEALDFLRTVKSQTAVTMVFDDGDGYDFDDVQSAIEWINNC